MVPGGISSKWLLAITACGTVDRLSDVSALSSNIYELSMRPSTVYSKRWAADSQVDQLSKVQQLRLVMHVASDLLTAPQCTAQQWLHALPCPALPRPSALMMRIQRCT